MKMLGERCEARIAELIEVGLILKLEMYELGEPEAPKCGRRTGSVERISRGS